jgi:hypothetical protein
LLIHQIDSHSCSVEIIAKCCFLNCHSLARVTFENDSRVSTLGDGAFCDCSALTTFPIPSLIESIAAYCLNGCANLSSVTFESGSRVSSLNEWAFFGCSALKSICFPPLLARVSGLAMARSMISEILIDPRDDPGNSFLTVCADFLTSTDGLSALRYFQNTILDLAMI